MSEQSNRARDIAELPELLARIRRKLPDLIGEERSLAEHILLNFGSVSKLSLVEMAESAQVSPSTVVQFCDDVGCEGFHALHTALSRVDSVAASVFFENVDTFDLEHTVTSVFNNLRQTVDRTLESLDMESMRQAVDAISMARTVLIIGLGTSGSVAQEFSYRLEWIGVNCEQYVDPHRQLMATTVLTDQDLAIAVSHSGRTKNVVNTLRLAGERGAKTMCITDFPNSPITKVADICVCAVHAENTLGVEMVATRAAHLALVDAIAMCVALRNRERAINSINLNERLLVNLRY
jgi:DNA-binding MurR/RpiR family transcriptional regulator